MTDIFLQGSISDALGQESLSVIQKYLVQDFKNFNERCNFFGLDPTSDLKHSDLSGIDFSNSDLRGHDFTGSNLIRSFGISVNWDDSTIFKGCDLNSSIFEFQFLLKDFEENDPVFAKELKYLKSQDSDWSFLYVHQKSSQGNSLEKRRGLMLARALYFESKGIVAKNNLLYCIRAYSDDKNDLRSFLLYLLSLNLDEDAVSPCLSMAARNYPQDPTFLEIFEKLASEGKSEKVRFEALGCLFRAADNRRVRELLLTMASTQNKKLRIVIGNNIAARLGKKKYLPVDHNGRFDFEENVTKSQIDYHARLLARESLIADRRAIGLSTSAILQPDAHYLNAAYKEIFSLLSDFQQFGITVKASRGIPIAIPMDGIVDKSRLGDWASDPDQAEQI